MNNCFHCECLTTCVDAHTPASRYCGNNQYKKFTVPEMPKQRLIHTPPLADRLFPPMKINGERIEWKTPTDGRVSRTINEVIEEICGKGLATKDDAVDSLTYGRYVMGKFIKPEENQMSVPMNRRNWKTWFTDTFGISTEGPTSVLDFIRDLRVESEPNMFNGMTQKFTLTGVVPDPAEAMRLKDYGLRKDRRIQELEQENAALRAKLTFYEHRGSLSVPSIEGVFFNGKHTTIRWADKTTTTVGVGEGETFEEYTGFIAAVAKKMFGGTKAAKRFLDGVKHVQKPKQKKKKGS